MLAAQIAAQLGELPDLNSASASQVLATGTSREHLDQLLVGSGDALLFESRFEPI